MRKRLLSLVFAAGACFTANAQYQLANSDFEEWESVSYSGRTGNEPVKWSSFLDGTGNLKSMAGYIQLEKSTDKPAASAGSYSAKLTSRAVKMGAITLAVAQGNLTNGCVNMGSTNATDASGNYNYINTDREDQSMKFTGRPDAVKVWVKFSGTKTGNVEVILVGDMKGKRFQSPESSKNPSTAELIAKAQNASIPSNNTWTEYTIPFTYSSESKPAYSLVNISTCATPGAGKAADYMFVDDMVLLYYSELSSATYDGNDVLFNGTSATVNELYDEAKLDLTSNGRAATIEKSYDAETALLTITVKGENISDDSNNKHVYTIQFAKKETYTEDLYVTVDGMTSAPQETTVVVTRYSDHFDFSLKNFVLGEGEASMPVGNINVTNLVENIDGTFSFKGNITIANGDDPNVGWFGPLLDEVPLDLTGQFVGDNHVRVAIDIDMSESIEQIINVHLGYDAANIAINAKAKYGTFCAPFDVKIPAGVTAYTIDNADANGSLNTHLTELNNTIPANTPVLVYAEDFYSEDEQDYVDKDLCQFGVATALDTPTSGLLTGVYSDTPAPFGAYVLQKHGDKVGFYEVAGKQPTVKANRCYLKAPAGANVKAFYFDQETAVEAIEALTSGKADIYDLNGRKLNKLQKGVNIVNGVKVLVK